MALENRLFANNFAYDLHKEIITKGEAIDSEAINVSIENIISTLYGERIFSPYFGSDMAITLFEAFTESDAQLFLGRLIEAIKRWETRITLIEHEIDLKIFRNENSMALVLPYIIDRNGLTNTFSKKIIV